MARRSVVEIVLRGTDRAGPAISSVARRLRELRNVAAGVATGVTAAFAAIVSGQALGGLLSSFIATEDVLKRTQATIRGSAADYAALRQQTVELGNSTEFTATQVAQAQLTLARAGFSLEEVIGALPSVLDLAIVAGAELAEVSDVVVAAIRAFNLDISELDSIANQLAATANNANTTVLRLGQAIGVAGQAALRAGFGIDELLTTFAALQDAGVRTERASTAVQKLFQEIATNDAAREGIQRLGGDLNSLTSIIDALDDGTAAQLAVIEDFGVEASLALSTLATRGAASVKRLNTSIVDSTDVLAEAVGTISERTQGALNTLRSALQGAAEAISEQALQGIADRIRDLASNIRDLVNSGGFDGLASGLNSILEGSIATANAIVKFSDALVFLTKLGIAALIIKIATAFAGVVTGARAAAVATGTAAASSTAAAGAYNIWAISLTNVAARISGVAAALPGLAAAQNAANFSAVALSRNAFTLGDAFSGLGAAIRNPVAAVRALGSRVGGLATGALSVARGALAAFSGPLGVLATVFLPQAIDGFISFGSALFDLATGADDASESINRAKVSSEELLERALNIVDELQRFGGVVIKPIEDLRNLSEKANEAYANELQQAEKLFTALAIAQRQLGDDAGAREFAARAREYAEALDAANSNLKTLRRLQAEAFQANQDNTQALENDLKALGTSLREITTGIDDETAKVIDGVRGLFNNILTSSDQLKAGIEAALGAVKTPEALEELLFFLVSSVPEVDRFAGGIDILGEAILNLQNRIRILGSEGPSTFATLANAASDVEGAFDRLGQQSVPAIVTEIGFLSDALADVRDSGDVTGRGLQRAFFSFVEAVLPKLELLPAEVRNAVLETVKAEGAAAGLGKEFANVGDGATTSAKAAEQLRAALDAAKNAADGLKNIGDIKAEFDGSKESVEAVTEQLEKARKSREDSVEQTEKQKTAQKEVTEETEETEEAAGGLAAAIAAAIDNTFELSRAAGNALLGIREISEGFSDSSEEAQRLNEELNTTQRRLQANREVIGGAVDGFGRFFVEVDRVREGFFEQAVQVENATEALREAGRTGELSMLDIQRAAQLAKGTLDLLDDTQFNDLRAEVDRVFDLLEERTARAIDGVRDLQAQLAQLEGRQADAVELRGQEDIADIEAALAAARQAGNFDEIQALQEQLALRREILAIQIQEAATRDRERQTQGNGSQGGSDDAQPRSRAPSGGLSNGNSAPTFVVVPIPDSQIENAIRDGITEDVVRDTIQPALESQNLLRS